MVGLIHKLSSECSYETKFAMRRSVEEPVTDINHRTEWLMADVLALTVQAFY